MEDNLNYIEKYIEETKEIIEKIDKKEIDNFIKILYDIWKKDKKVITAGNGGSASTASHFASDLAKTVSNDSSKKEISSLKGFKSICMNDNPSLLTAWINDSGWENAYSGILNTFLEKEDAILLISVHGGSGWSGNLVKAIETARSKGAKVLGLVGFDGGQMKTLSDVCITIPKDSTPHTEGIHLVIQHLIVERLRQLINEEEEK